MRGSPLVTDPAKDYTISPTPFKVAKHDVRLAGALIDIDESTGKARSTSG